MNLPPIVSPQEWDASTSRRPGGITTVRFTHRDLWDEEAVRSHEGGWGKAFDNLERTLEAARPRSQWPPRDDH